MRVRIGWWLALAMMAPLPVLGAVVLAPHDRAGESENSCHYCHSLAVNGGGGMNFNGGCLDCHQSHGSFGMPWVATDEAVPGVTGNQHNWSGSTTSPEHGAAPNVSVSYLEPGMLQCAVCHDTHPNTVPAAAKSMHVSVAVGVGLPKAGTAYGDQTGTAEMTVTAPPGSGVGAFRLQIRSIDGDNGGGTFILSHYYAFNPNHWFNWNGSAWVEGVATGPGKPFRYGTTETSDVGLDVSGVKVRWAKPTAPGAVVGDYWDFYIAYPFLRLSNRADEGCVACHKERVMNHVRARGDDRLYRPNGVRKFSHPVNVGLNANGMNADRAVVLDADGTAGSSTTDGAGGVANATNDLVMTDGVVRCTTCHAPHNADSNSLSVDAR